MHRGGETRPRRGVAANSPPGCPYNKNEHLYAIGLIFLKVWRLGRTIIMKKNNCLIDNSIKQLLYKFPVACAKANVSLAL
jgi:hypothetical protein